MPDIFETALKNSSSVSDLYFNDLALSQKLTDDPVAFEELLRKMRQQMQSNGGIGKFTEINPVTIERVTQLHNAGEIAAIDGTDAISPTQVLSKTVYAAGVITVTARTLARPRITMTESYQRIPPIDDDDDFFKFVQKLDDWVDDESSWVRTFREHCERDEALRAIDEDDVSVVLIDGPLYTQNLLTQSVERRADGVLDRMQRRTDRLIGFIKELHSSKVMHLAGMALQPGEFWTVRQWRNVVLADIRFKTNDDVRNWILGGRDWVRTIYRKNARAFAFECDPDLVEFGVALVASPVTCGAIINHEIPFLLHAADRIVQASVAAAAKSENLISALPQYANLANERVFR